MRVYKYLLLMIIFCSTIAEPLIAQEKELFISYKFERLRKYPGKDMYHKARPQNIDVFALNNGVVVRKIIAIMTSSFKNGEMIHGAPDTVFSYIKFDYKDNFLYEKLLRGDGMLLKEPLNLFKWKLEKETKTILGYTCLKATCNFRGRNYEAFFTRDLPFKATPWKFHGLPGTILEVYSTDGFCKWEAQKLTIRPKGTAVDLQLEGLKPVNLNQYIDYLKKQKRRILETRKKTALLMGNTPIGNSKLSDEIEIFDPDLIY